MTAYDDAVGAFEAAMKPLQNPDQAWLYSPEGGCKEFPAPKDLAGGYTLEEMREAIGGGYIEIVTIQRNSIRMIVDEEGMLKKLPTNDGASLLYWAGGGQTPIFGHALVIPWGWVK